MLNVLKKLRSWCPQPQDRLSTKIKSYAKPTAIVAATLILAISVTFIFTQYALTQSVAQAPIIKTPTENSLNASIAPTATPEPSPSPTSTLIPIPVDFTIPVGLTVGGSSNVFTVNVDLNDGMSRDEAIIVGETILNRELTNAIHTVKSAEVNSEGIWNVNFNWEYANLTLENGTQLTPVLSHFFDVIINPENQTATYTRCE